MTRCPGAVSTARFLEGLEMKESSRVVQKHSILATMARAPGPLHTKTEKTSHFLEFLDVSCRVNPAKQHGFKMWLSWQPCVTYPEAVFCFLFCVVVCCFLD